MSLSFASTPHLTLFDSFDFVSSLGRTCFKQLLLPASTYVITAWFLPQSVNLFLRVLIHSSTSWLLLQSPSPDCSHWLLLLSKNSES
jgi:hypothetical protein